MNKSKLIIDIKKARKEGHKIKVRKRSDGGYIVTSVDGVKYSGAKGNARVREITGSEVSKYQKTQLERITRNRPKHRKKAKPYNIDDEIRRAQNRINRKRRKNEVEGGGYISKKKIRYNIDQYGKEETLRRLQDAERYAEGYAYLDNVEWLISRLKSERDFSDYPNEWTKIIDYIEAHKLKFKDSTLSEIYNILGSPKAKNAEMGNTEQQKIIKIKKLLNLETDEKLQKLQK